MVIAEFVTGDIEVAAAVDAGRLDDAVMVVSTGNSDIRVGAVGGCRVEAVKEVVASGSIKSVVSRK
jgi:hypothetical protein